MAKLVKALQRGLNLPPSRVIENELARRFGKLNDKALRLVQELLIPALRTDNPALIEEALRAIADALSQDFDDDKIEKDTRIVAERVNNNHRRLFFAGIAAVTGLKIIGSDSPVRDIVVPGLLGIPRRRGALVAKLNPNPEIAVELFIIKNTKLIETLRQGVVEGIREAVSRATVEGISADELARDLLKQWKKQGVPSKIPTAAGARVVSIKKHATLIARDQIAKLNGQIARERQMAAGIRKFVWETQKDRRVRKAHKKLQNKVFTWEGGWNGVFPGQPVGCRCWARAVVDADLVEKEGNFINLTPDV